ncbi:MAG: PD40 domain-containing protein [Planctomycetes bacterium]|nr:PD40 domain-containing protein [Planctomycetota bacterium]
MTASHLPRLLPVALTIAAAATAQTRLLRFPDIHGDQVVFTYAGDLWKAPISGGTATRLTTARGVELFAKWSPDGRWIAFTGQIDGDEQVYVVPSEGGEPRQLTFYPARGPLPDRWGYDHQVYGWTPDGSAVLFRSLRDAFTLTRGQLFTVAMPAAARRRGALPVALPMPVSGAGDFSPDGERIVYAPLFRDFRTWKRYEGGWATDLFVFDPATRTSVNITDHPRTDRDPMWIGEHIWFASDRSGTLNLWSYDLRSKTAHQETQSTVWDVRWPSAGGPEDQRIVYEQGGELHWFDCRSKEDHPIAIRVPDDGRLNRPTVVDATAQLEHYALSPGGGRAAFAARGEILTVPKEHGDVRNLTNSPGAHDKHPAFSPDGATVAFVSDRSGEEQIWLVDHLGAAPPRQLTKGLAVMLYAPVWSPDGKTIAFGDKDGVVRLCDVATGALTEIADEAHGQVGDLAWSPCSGHLAFSLTGDNELSAVWVYTLADKTLRRVSRPLADDSTPAWDPRGERLFFLGLRGYQPRLATTYEWDFQIDRAYGIYALALRRDLPAWLPPRSDEAVVADPAAAAPPKFDAPIAIDWDGLAERVEAVPVELDNYAGLSATADGLLFTRRGGSYYGRGSDQPTTLHTFSAKTRKTEQLASGIGGYALSPDGTHVLIRKGRAFVVAAANDKGKDGQTELALDLRVEKVPSDEYWQIFEEVWRRYRDFFYVANMHGHDWQALHDRYAPLVAHVRHRSDLNYVIGEMIAELSVGHAYIAGGDTGAPERATPALPGLRLEFDAAAAQYRIRAVLAGENDDAELRSPATAVGVDLRVGDYLLAIDGQPLSAEVNPYKLLKGKAGRHVTLLVNGRPQVAEARAVTIAPIETEEHLVYHAWVQANRRRVDELSGGKLGYVHLPDMGAAGIREFVRQYYAQRDKQGLVFDDRYNGGGNISQMVVNRLQRQLLMCTFGRTSGYRPYPRALFDGPMVCLLNESSASDGDIFPAMFRRAGLGKLVGKRSWGGIIGITNRGMLLDGGTVNVPEFGNTEPGPEWTIEGHGVDPDVVVDNDLGALLAGRDPQLEKGVQIVLEELRAAPRPPRVAPPAPVKTGR